MFYAVLSPVYAALQEMGFKPQGKYMDRLKQQVDSLMKAKADRRKALARLPWPEKVRMTVGMQKMAWPVVRGRSERACIWKLPEFEARKS